jgi:hypothetical protein
VFLKWAKGIPSHALGIGLSHFKTPSGIDIGYVIYTYLKPGILDAFKIYSFFQLMT